MRDEKLLALRVDDKSDCKNWKLRSKKKFIIREIEQEMWLRNEKGIEESNREN